MNIVDIRQVCIAYVCAIEYGDYSGLSDDDERLVTQWLDKLPAGVSFDWGEESEFCRDDISGLMADCIEVKIYHQE